MRHKNKKLVSIMAKTERQKRIYRKRIPYGMQNFEDVIKEDCYFVDKTPFIENIEESNKYFFFIRPRRFGKSLTISMLENYYDINKKDQKIRQDNHVQLRDGTQFCGQLHPQRLRYSKETM